MFWSENFSTSMIKKFLPKIVITYSLSWIVSKDPNGLKSLKAPLSITILSLTGCTDLGGFQFIQDSQNLFS